MAATQSSISADEALKRLVAGNERFRLGKSNFARFDVRSLQSLEASQQPYATVLGCSDSRVPPELIFDSGLGDLFVIRVAGNVFSPEVAASLQYAGAHLLTQLFVVLGHQNCGAVSAALQSRDNGKQELSRIQLLINNILPGLPPFDPALSSKARINQAVESNVRWTVQRIVNTPEGQVRLAQGKMKIVGAIYELATGEVRFLNPELVN